MTPDEVIKGIQNKNRLLTAKNEELLELSEKRAQAERTYNIAFGMAILEWKKAGHPVTIIRDLVKGNKVVADIKYDLDVTDGVYQACRESIKDIRTAIDTYRSLLSWLKSELESQ